jgi:hypothetical protein
MTNSRMFPITTLVACSLVVQAIADDGRRESRFSPVRSDTAGIIKRASSGTPKTSEIHAVATNGNRKHSVSHANAPDECTKSTTLTNDVTPKVRIAEFTYISRMSAARKAGIASACLLQTSGPAVASHEAVAKGPLSGPIGNSTGVEVHERAKASVLPSIPSVVAAPLRSTGAQKVSAPTKVAVATKQVDTEKDSPLTWRSTAAKKSTSAKNPAPAPATLPAPRIVKRSRATVVPVSYSPCGLTSPRVRLEFKTSTFPWLCTPKHSNPTSPIAEAKSLLNLNTTEPKSVPQRAGQNNRSDQDVAHSSRSYIDDLRSLVSKDETTENSADNTGNYLTDLNHLLGRQSQWIIARGAVMDLAPGEPQPEDYAGTSTYMNDLQKLIGPSQAGTRRRPGRSLIAYSTYPQDAASPYEIPPEEPCTASGDKSVTGLFQPVKGIDVHGYSTQPPEERLELRPENVRDPKIDLACDFLETEMPGYYATQGYGYRRAPRNTHKFYHHPLYFEDPNQERCGQSKGCLTTACSAVHFTTMMALTPYLTTVDHPRDCVQALPDCRTCQSFGTDSYFPRWSWKAAAVQTAAVTGLVFIIP